MPFCTFHQNCFISTPRGIPGLERHQPDPPRPRASAPCPLHTAALSPAILRSRVIPSRRWNLVGFLRASWHAAYIRRTIHNSSLLSQGHSSRPALFQFGMEEGGVNGRPPRGLLRHARRRPLAGKWDARSLPVALIARKRKLVCSDQNIPGIICIIYTRYLVYLVYICIRE